MSAAFDKWRKERLPELKAREFSCSSIKNVTLLAYFFWPEEIFDERFDEIEFAFLSAYETFGLMPSTLVVNRESEKTAAFARRYGARVIVEPHLDCRDGVKSLCLESISRLHTRFDTEYVLTLQNDGMPLRPGLEKFLGKYDYIGAPWPGHTAWWDLYPYPKYGVGNGGFSLRSHRICEAAAEAYATLSRFIPYWQPIFGDDVFYAKFLPFFSRRFRHEFKIAPIEVAAEFSIEGPTRYHVKPPLGFHRGGFDEYVKRFGVDHKTKV